jgi:hypothetical protein
MHRPVGVESDVALGKGFPCPVRGEPFHAGAAEVQTDYIFGHCVSEANYRRGRKRRARSDAPLYLSLQNLFIRSRRVVPQFAF